MNMKKLLFFCLAVLCLASCGAYKRLAYLQDMDPLATYDVTQRSDPRIAIGDDLSIKVSSSYPQLVAPFNVMTATTTYDVVTQVESFKNVGEGGSVYHVDKNGKIEFPVLGSIFVEGMTPEDLETLIEDAIKSKNYVSDPSVTISFSNFKVYLLGEVKAVGPLDVPTGGINVFQAISQAGDLTDEALRDNVWVIRTTGDTRKAYTLNLKSRKVFDSPAFYLQQDDIVYVAPKDTKRDKSIENSQSFLTTLLSAISTFGTILLWLTVYTK